MKHLNFYSVLFILSPLVFTFAFALDIYIPAVPDMPKIFHTSQATVQLTLSMFMLICGFGQLFVGPLSDQYGRRKITLISIAIFTLGSLLCVLSPSIGFLIFARSVQALGACGMMVTAFAIVRDLFEGKENFKAFSYLNGSIAISPLLAPLIGGYLIYWFNWQASFVFLTIFGIFTFLLIYKKVTETRPPEHKIVMDRQLFKRYLTILQNVNFRSYVSCASSGMAIFFTFFSSSSIILIKLLDVPIQYFGYYFALIGIVFFLGSLLSAYLTSHIGLYKSVFLGSILLIGGGVWMLGWELIHGLTIWGFMVPMMLTGLGGAIFVGGGAAGSLEHFKEMAGTASALLGASQFVFAFFVGTLVLLIPVTSTRNLSLTILVLGAFCLITLSRNKLKLLG